MTLPSVDLDLLEKNSNWSYTSAARDYLFDTLEHVILLRATWPHGVSHAEVCVQYAAMHLGRDDALALLSPTVAFTIASNARRRSRRILQLNRWRTLTRTIACVASVAVGGILAKRPPQETMVYSLETKMT